MVSGRRPVLTRGKAGCAAFVGGLLALGCEPGEDPGPRSLRVRATPPGSTIALVDYEKGLVIAKAQSLLETTKAMPNHEVWVGAPDHDVWRQRVGERVEADVVLRRAEQSAVLSLQRRKVSADSITVHLAQVLGSWPRLESGSRAPFAFSSRSALTGDLTIPVPEGLRVSAMLHSEEFLVVPPFLDSIDPGATVPIQAVEPRKVDVAVPGGTGAGNASVDRMLLAYDAPHPESAAWQNAIQWWVARPGWGKAFWRNGRVELEGVPPADIHVFLRHADGAEYLRLRARDNSVGLRGRGGQKMLRGIPTILGTPAPAGTRIIPGRHDLLSATEVLSMKAGETYWRDVTSEFPVAVPASGDEYFTLVTPDFRLAIGTWRREAQIQEATLFPGKLTVDFGRPVDKVIVRLAPTWPLAGLRSADFGRDWPAWTRTQLASIEGLPLGTYLGFAWFDDQDLRKQPRPAGTEFSFSLTESSPTTSVRVKPPIANAANR